ncbi:uncharacterized protein LOC134932872 isoform X2 [Pseudophryne corroboree]|uniref:uncharacterized protein LOC134932872 isoform X2 n=1 Tax=Pseudophryne corroboree TaxID=495146 RepID=UPI003081BD8F
MSTQTRVNGFTAWINMRLLEFNGHVNNILHDLFQGTNMRILLESFTGKALRRFESLDGLTQQQIITRVEWFVSEMKKIDVLPQNVLNLLWKLISYDLLFTWERSSQLMHRDDKVICSVPFKWTPEAAPPMKEKPESRSVSSILASLDVLSKKSLQPDPEERIAPPQTAVWHPFPGRAHAQSFNKNIPKGGWASYPSPEQCVLQIVNSLLKEASKDASTEIMKIEDLVHCNVICTIVNYFLPHTFAIDVILDDRWAVNVALKTLEALLFITTSFSCDDLLQGDLQAVCAYLCFVCMAGFKYKQSRSVVNYTKQLTLQIEVAMSKLQIFSSGKLELNQSAEKYDLQQKVIEMKNELQWLKKSYDLDRCQKWVKHARKVQKKTKDIIQQKIKDRFEIVALPRPLSIHDLCLTLGINLQLTQGSGFYHLCHKQTLTAECRVVLQKKDTQQFIDDFSGSHKTSVRKLLNLPLQEVTEVNPNNYTDYKLFIECKSKNKMLKANSLFLYQVFPGNSSQWLKILHQAINNNEYCRTVNLLRFFKETCPHLINLEEMSSGCSALHLACQKGFFDTVLILLENGASMDKLDGNHRTPLHYALVEKHRNICQLLIEWGCRIRDHNISGQLVPATLNQDLKEFCKGYSEMWQTAIPEVLNGNITLLKKMIGDHEKGNTVMASLRSRCVDGSTLLHVAAYFGDTQLVESILKLQVEVDILDYRESTPLQRSRDVKTMQLLLNHGADIHWKDHDGNTALHMICYGEPGKPSRMDCLQLLLSNGVSTRKCNKNRLLPIHCAAIQGRTDVVQAVVESGTKERELINEHLMLQDTPSLPYLAMANDHLECAIWLVSNKFNLRDGEDAELLFDITFNKDEKGNKVQQVRFLITSGLNVNICDNKGNSAVHLAARHIENYDIMKLLLSSGAEVDTVNNDCITPLFNAVHASNFHGARLLLDYGANLEHQDNGGLTAFDHIKNVDDWIACGIFSDEMNELLRAYDLQQSIHLVRRVAEQIKMERPA